MSQQNPTIIVGHLDDSELTKSIDKLVNEVANKTTTMAGHFTTAIGKMQDAMKDFAVTQKVSVDLMKEAWRDMSKSFDAMVAAQSGATGGGKGSGKGKVYAPDTVGALEQEIAEIKQERKELELNSNELRTQNALLERRKNLYKEQTTSPATKRIDSAMSMSTSKLDEAQKKLRLLEILQRRYSGTTELSVAQQNRLARAIQKTKEQIDKLKPKSLNDVLGMDANSIDQIAAKMRALKMVRIDPNNAAEVKRVGDAYAELKRKQAQLMGQNIQLTHSNNYLAQSFGYIRNRIVYALTLGAITSFIKQLYEIRGQYELLERSLGVLVGSFEKGTQIFNELNEMAIKSPFTLIELGTAAKQLTAYNFAANEVVDTTRRLADISAALGVPIERLTYNLGQIKAQGVLNARDARDFANAGLAIVPMLAKMYTEQKTFGDEMVTTAQVYDMMSKKMVTYSDVLKVLYKVTDEGGKFFDFQAKQADTLRVQMANLTLAYNNMLNEIGAENQGILSGIVSGLKTLLKNWREISRAILTLVTTLGTYKAIAAIVSALNSRMFVGSILVNLRNYILGIKNATGAMATFNAVTKANPIAFLISALVAAIGYFVWFKKEVQDVSAEIEMFGESASKTISKVNTLKKVIDGTDDTSNTYKKTLSELSSIAKEYGIELDAEKARRDEINKATEQTIQLIKEESAERQRANQLTKAQENYDAQANSARQSLRDSLKTAMTGTDFGIFTTKSDNKEIQQNADAIADIIGSVVESNIMLIAGKTGDEYEKGLDKMFSIIQTRMKAIGISESTISKQWLSSTLFSNTNLVNEYINNIVRAKNEQDNYVEKIEKNYKVAKKATEATMTFTQKVDANARALHDNTDDAISLYNKIYDIVKIAQQNHTINFDLKLTADNPPKWMFDKSLPELQRLAQRFAAIAQSGGHAKGYDREGTYQQALRYASAARQKQEEEERNARNKDKDTRTKQSDEIAKAIKKEISLVKELQSAYDTLTKKGDSHANAIAKVQDLYGKTIDLLNKDMDKFGLPRLDLSIIKGNNHNEVLAFFEKLRDVLESKGLSNLERMEAVEGVVKEFRLKADTYNLDMITKGLNNELGKLKDEYELAVELDANPELGGIFADYMGIDLNELPKNAEEAAKKAQQYIDKILRENKSKEKIDIASLMGKDAFDKWIKSSGHSMEDDIVKVVDNYRQALHKMQVDESKKQMQEWEKLLEKYAEYEYKVTQIQKEAEREREIARKKGASQEILDAINNREKQELARVSFEEFQKTPEWIVATGDLANMSKSAIGMLIEQLEKYKRSAKNLSPKQIKQLNSALSKLYKEQRKNNPFKAISNMLDEAKERMATFDEDIEKTQDEIDKLTKKKKESVVEGIADEETDNKLKKAIKRLKELKEAREKTGKVDASSWVSSINETIGAVQSAIGVFNDLAKAIGGVDSNDLDKVFSVVDKAGQGAAIGAQIGGGWGALIGAVAGAATGLISIFAGAANERITDKVEESERAVKRLELAYKNLEVAIDEAYGANVIGAKQAAIANKELQLAELRRQLALEKSRDSKDRDEDRIIELQGQIIDLQNDIKRSMQEVATGLLGISSVGDAALSFMDAYISALRKGEDAQKAFTGNWKEMIANMIKQLWVTKVIGPQLEALVDDMNKRISERSKPQAEAYEKAKDKETRLSTMNGKEILSEMTGIPIELLTWDMVEQNKDLIEKYVSSVHADVEKTKKELDKATIPTIEDMDMVAQAGEDLLPLLQASDEQLNELLKKYGLYEDQSDKTLSSLQQGIQGITEDTAGALEAYMNGVSQQVYLHSDLLTQIRDAVVGIDIDVQVATQAQMLLQLQQSYAVQMAIQGILEGTLNPSGQGFRVELIN